MITRLENKSTLCSRKSTLASALREMFRVQLYKNNAHALLSRILNLDWLQHARSVRGVYEWKMLCELLEAGKLGSSYTDWSSACGHKICDPWMLSSVSLYTQLLGYSRN